MDKEDTRHQSLVHAHTESCLSVLLISPAIPSSTPSSFLVTQSVGKSTDLTLEPRSLAVKTLASRAF